MPEVEKQENMVDIDTSGPGAEINLEDQNTETEGVENEANETPVNDTQSDDADAKSDEQPDVQAEQPKEEEAKSDEPVNPKTGKKFSEEEIEQYGHKVKNRISKLTGKLREAERREQAALEYAQSVLAEKNKLNDRLSKLDTNYVAEVETRIKSGMIAAEAKLASARESGDIKSEVEAQKEIARLGFEEGRLADLKSKQVKLEKTEKPVEQAYQQQQFTNQQQPAIDQKTQSWIDKNKDWFGPDRALTAVAYSIHEDLLNEGYDGSTDEYFSELDTRLRVEFPSKFANTEEQNTTERARPAQTVASAKRPAQTGRKKTVKLSPSEVAIAKKLGISLEDYAKQKQTLNAKEV